MSYVSRRSLTCGPVAHTLWLYVQAFQLKQYLAVLRAGTESITLVS